MSTANAYRLAMNDHVILWRVPDGDRFGPYVLEYRSKDGVAWGGMSQGDAESWLRCMHSWAKSEARTVISAAEAWAKQQAIAALSSPVAD